MALIDDFKLHQDLHLQALGNLHGGIPEGLPGQLQELAPTVAAFEAATRKIEADRNLSAEGRRAALAKAREDASAGVEQWKVGKIAGIDGQIAAQQQTLAKADPGSVQPTEFAIQFMAAILAKHDPLENEVLYSDATEGERVTMELASESLGRLPRRRGPTGDLVWEPVLSPERIAAARVARQAEKNPSAVSALADARRIRNVYVAMSSAAVELLGK
jgi:hypothetical protein